MGISVYVLLLVELRVMLYHHCKERLLRNSRRPYNDDEGIASRPFTLGRTPPETGLLDKKLTKSTGK
jgi:hypothetical protein